MRARHRPPRGHLKAGPHACGWRPGRPVALCYIKSSMSRKVTIMETLELLFASLVRETAESIRDHHVPFSIKHDERAYFEWMDGHPISGYIQEAYREIEETAQQIRAIRAG
jgi:hypothetical protein